jgi:hypothetical protein
MKIKRRNKPLPFLFLPLLPSVTMLVSMMLLVLLIQQLHVVTSTNPIFSGSLLSLSTGQSCANIYDTEGNKKMQCNTATTAQVSLDTGADGGVYQFLFSANSQSSLSPEKGGSGGVQCNSNNPGQCVQGQDFYVVFNVTPIKVSYGLNSAGLEVPFGYVYGNSLTRKPSSSSYGPYPDQITGLCGVTESYSTNDYTACGDSTIFPPGNPTRYSQCAVKGGLDILIGMEKNINYCSSNMNDLVDQYSNAASLSGPNNLMCKSPNLSNLKHGCIPFLPMPSGLCQCGGSHMEEVDTTAPNAPTTDYVSMTVCRSGSCAGTCGSALSINPDTINVGTNPCSHTCDPLDPKSICANTGQMHRCPKCQPGVGKKSGTQGYCYYFDLNTAFRCGTPDDGSSVYENLDLSDYCGLGYTIYGGTDDPTKGWDHHATAEANLVQKDARQCNCDANFVEKAYPVTPFCVPYTIMNPPRLEYTVDVYFTYLNHSRVDGSDMVVGNGWGPTSVFGNVTNLPTSAYTPDTFALTQIVSVDSPTGKLTGQLDGYITMCNSQPANPCGAGAQNISLQGLPTANINTSSGDGRLNPWTTAFMNGEPRVPLPYQVYRYANGNTGDVHVQESSSQENAWWYYVPKEATRTYGRGCGQNGWFPSGPGDMAAAASMCNGPQGTCIPGLDTISFGEAVNPPCNVATDFIEYVAKNGYACASWQEVLSGQCDCRGPTPPSSQHIRPKHVPADWNPNRPQYYVHGGRLFKDADPTVFTASIRVALSIAADFVADVISEGPGQIVATTCDLLLDIGTGQVNVEIMNTGTDINSYIIKTSCTQGIYSNPNGVGTSAYPGNGGPGSDVIVPLTLLTDTELKSSTDPNVPYCNVSLYPSVLGNQFGAYSVVNYVHCTVVFALPVIQPNSPGQFQPNNIGKYIAPSDKTGCTGGWTWIGCEITEIIVGPNRKLLSPMQTFVVLLFTILTGAAILICLVTCQAQQSNKEYSRLKGVTDGMEKSLFGGAAVLGSAMGQKPE